MAELCIPACLETPGHGEHLKGLSIASGRWEAVRENLVNGARELRQLSQELAARPAQEVQHLSRLTSLRLLDILAWTIGGS